MITLEHKLRSESKFMKFLDKIIPDTFELKYAKLLDSLIKNSIFKHQNYDSSQMWQEEFAAKYNIHESLRKKNILNKLEKFYFLDNTDYTLLSFYDDEIKDLARIRNAAANSVGIGLGFIFETFNLSNQAVSNRLNEYYNTIDLFIENYFAITNYKKIHSKNRHNSLVINHIQYSNSYHTSFHNSISIEAYKRINLENEIIEIKANYILYDYVKLERHEARIIEYFISELHGYDYTSHKEREPFLKKLYNITHRSYREDFSSEFEGKKEPKIKLPHLAKAILFIDYQILHKKHPHTFTIILLEKMIHKYVKLKNEKIANC